MKFVMQKNKIQYLLGIVFFFLVLSISNVQAGAVGFGKINVQSDCPENLCPFFSNPDGVWVFEWTNDGYTTDRVRASWDASDLNSKQDFTIDIDGTENYCKYDIKREADRLDIFTVDFETYKKTFWSWEYNVEGLKAQSDKLAFERGCLQIDDYPQGWAGIRKITSGIVQDTVEVFCFKKRDNLGKLGSIRNLKYVTKTDWSIKAEDKITYSDTISNDETGSGRTTRLGNNVLIQWQGLLSSGDTCPISTEELIAYNTDFSNNWKVIDRHNYINYEDYIRSELDNLARKIYDGVYTKSSAEQIINSKSGKAIQERSFSDFNVIIIDSSINSGALKINLDRIIRFPKFRLS